MKPEKVQSKEKLFVFRRLAYVLIFVAIIAIPVWIGIGRGFWGVGGWDGIGTVFYLAPVLLIFHLICMIFVLGNTSVRKKKLLPLDVTVVLYVYLLIAIVFEVTMVEIVDTHDANSVLTLMMNGLISRDVSTAICTMSFWLGIGSGILLLWLIVRALHKNLYQAENDNLPADIVQKIAQISGSSVLERDKPLKSRRRRWRILTWVILTPPALAAVYFVSMLIGQSFWQRNYEVNYAPYTIGEMTEFMQQCRVVGVRYVDDNPKDSRVVITLTDGSSRSVSKFDALAAYQNVTNADCNDVGVIREIASKLIID